MRFCLANEVLKEYNKSVVYTEYECLYIMLL